MKKLHNLMMVQALKKEKELKGLNKNPVHNCWLAGSFFVSYDSGDAAYAV